MPTPEGLCTKLEEVVSLLCPALTADQVAHLSRLSREAAEAQRREWCAGCGGCNREG